MILASSRYPSHLERARCLMGAQKEVADSSADAGSAAKGSLDRKLRYAGLLTGQQRRSFFVSLALLIFGLTVIGTLVSSLVWFLAIPFSWCLFNYRLSRLAFERAQLFEKDYTALLLSLASSVRTGMDPMSALLHCRDLFPEQSLLHYELSVLKLLLESGEKEDRAISKFAVDILHPDLGLFRTAFILARREGSSLATCLQRLAKVTRHRQSFRRKVKSAVAMQRLSAIGIGACAIVIGIIQFTSNPDAMSKALQHPLGSKFLMLGVGLMVLGITWMLRLARSKI